MKKKRRKKGLLAGLVVVVLLLGGALFIRTTGILVKGVSNPLSDPVFNEGATETFAGQELDFDQKLLESGMAISVSESEPALFGLVSDLMVNNELVTDFTRTEPISFDGPYTEMEGIITFRGNNYRSATSYGVTDLESKEFDLNHSWFTKTGSLKKTVGDGTGEWSGSCWTGQPLIVRWKAETRRAMNLYEDKKAKDGLTEVIYATCDGNIYFLDLEDGTPTRDKISLGFPVKGTGSLYPNEIPLYFVGAGDSMGDDCARTFIVDLIKGEIIYEYGYDDEFSERTDNNGFHAYDSSPLIDVDTDTLIQPGENGILYTMKLNTKYDGASISINPDEMVKWRYTTTHSREDSYYLGMESSASIFRNYLYIADNCADLMCIDLNTMDVVWMQDTVDDTNASPVFEEDPSDGTGYLYIASSLHFTKDENNAGTINLEKINAANGEVIWSVPYECQTVAGISGGVQATALCGEQNLSDFVYFAIARTNGVDHGQLVAINKKTGAEYWHLDMEYYTWSSPIAMYDADGNGYLILCDSKGNMFFIDGITGKLYDTINLAGANIEATPAAFENTIVVGTRGVGTVSSLLGAEGKRIYGIRMK